MCGRAQLQLAGGGVYAKSGQWAATQEEADTIDRSIARNKAWVRSLQDKEQWLNRPRPNGTIGAALPLVHVPLLVLSGRRHQGHGGQAAADARLPQELAASTWHAVACSKVVICVQPC